MRIHRKLNTSGFKFLFSDACRVIRLLADCLNYGCVFVHIHYRQIYFPRILNFCNDDCYILKLFILF